MIDKQVIINGVNVSGCCQYMPRYMEDYDIDTLDYCRYHFKPCKDVDVKYCYYKQLKAKEQECERLKADLKSLEYTIVLQSNRDIDNAADLFAKRVAKIDNENSILKAENKNLKQALTEIKEIALGVRNYLDCPSPKDVRYEMDIILQLIREVEDDRQD